MVVAVPVSRIVSPVHTGLLEAAATMGFGRMVTTTLAVLLHAAGPVVVPVTVYVVVPAGVAITVAPVVVFKPVAGDQV